MIDPIERGFSITPSDTVDLEHNTRALYVGVSGDVALITVSGDQFTLVGLTAGIFHPLRVRRILSTGTTATSIFGCY